MVDLNILRVNPWISFRTYFPNSARSRTIISNEKSKNFYQLSGDSSDLFHYISNKFRTHTFDTDLSESNADEFLSELISVGVLSLDGREDHQSDSVVNAPEAGSTEYLDTIEGEMSAWAFRNNLLWSAHWEATYTCNERCVHCFNPGGRETIEIASQPTKEKHEMKTEDVMSMIDHLFDLGVFRLCISGGEASVRKDFLEILAYARSKGMCVDIFSNVLKWSDKFVASVANLWPHHVGVSIYSANPKLHDFTTRVPGSLDKTISSVKRLHNAGLTVNLKCALMDHTVQGYEHIKSLGKEIGIQVSFDTSITPRNDGDRSTVDFNISDFGELVVLSATPGSPKYVGDYKAEDITVDRNKPTCGAGRTVMSVDPFGDISPCVALPLKLGSICNGDLERIWKDASAAQRGVANSKSLSKKSGDLERWRDVRITDYDECGTHDYCFFCSRCPGKSALETGKMFAPSPSSCFQSKASLKAFQLLQEGKSRNEICELYSVPIEFGSEEKGRIPKIKRADRIVGSDDPSMIFENGLASMCLKD